MLLIRKFIILLICVFIAGAAAATANTCKDFADSGCRIDVEMHKSFIKQIDEPVTRVAVADPEIADVQLITPTQVLIISRKAVGTTSLTVWYGEDRAEVYDVRVYVPGNLLEVVQKNLKQLVPGAKVRILPAKNGVILDGEVESQEMLERVLRVVRAYVDVGDKNILITITGSQQVQLEVRIAEISRSGMKQMGLGFLNSRDWSIGLFPSGSATGSTAATVSEGDSNGSLDSDINISSPFSSAFQIALHSISDDSMAILSLLKGQGLSRMLASPTLVAMSGQEAEFLVGGEFPYPVPSNEGTTISYKKFGIMLGFTPTVIGKDTISLRVTPEVSSLDYASGVSVGGVAVPGLRTRRGSTTLQMKDGQTFAMAGLINEQVQRSLNKVPFLGDIPVLGTLFTSKEYQRSETELVIIVTPHLVRAMNPDEVPALPGEDHPDDLSDSDFFFKNRIIAPEQDNDSDGQTNSTPAFSGKTGFSR